MSERDDDMELEIIDDLPDEPEGQDGDEEDGLEGYSKRVKDRINKLTKQFREAERRAQEAARERDEAVNVARTFQQQVSEKDQLLSRGEEALIGTIKERAQQAFENAKQAYKDAHASGDPDRILAAQEKFGRAQTELYEAEQHERRLKGRRPPEGQQQPQQQPARQQPRQPDPKAAKWAERNTWFGTEPKMTAFAYGLHEELVKNGTDPSSDEYYRAIDAEMRKRFPEEFEDDMDAGRDTDGQDVHTHTVQTQDDRGTRQPGSRAQTPVVAPGGRNNGARPKKVTLTRTQVQLAKRLGITPEQYAQQLLKEQTR